MIQMRKVCGQIIIYVIFHPQESGGLHLGNKLTPIHIKYKDNKIKVRLAVQIFGQSTADALLTLSAMADIYPQFKDVQGTVTFLKVGKTGLT